MRKSYRDLICDHEWLPAAILLVLGCALRLACIGSLPYGLNQDEASAGYEAYALLTSGMDRCGNTWPVLLTAWGSGQNALMTYLDIPFVAALGLTELAVRLPNAIAGCLTLVVFWRLARHTRGKMFGLWALFFLAVNPWHIMASRWALESNLMPLLLITGLWFTSLAREKPWALLGAAACFGFSLYAYGTMFFFLPLFLIAAVIWLRKYLRPASFIVSLLAFILIALPISYCQAINLFGLDKVCILGVTLPKLTESRQAATSVFGGGGLTAARENFLGFLRLLLTQSDGLPYNSLGIMRGGIFYFFGLPAAILCLVFSLLTRRECEGEATMRIALVCGLICTFFISCNINRINMIWLPLVYFIALGCYFVLEKMGSWAVLPAAGVLACFCIFFSAYCGTFGGNGNVNYFPGLGGAIRAAEAADPESVYITDSVNASYIFALFYAETPPEDFAETVEYRDDAAAFRPVDRFCGFEFADRARADILILRRGEETGCTVLASSGDYLVCTPGGQ
jgi:hypothetical protein